MKSFDNIKKFPINDFKKIYSPCFDILRIPPLIKIAQSTQFQIQVHMHRHHNLQAQPVKMLVE